MVHFERQHSRASGSPGREMVRWVTLGMFMAMCLVAVTATGCSQTTAKPAGLKPSVVCTTGMIADAARVIAGESATVTALMGEGVDPHLYKASPGDIRTLSAADLVLYNGLHLEGRLGDILERLAKKQVVRAVTDGIDPARFLTPPDYEGQHDPHIWFDVSLWQDAVGQVRDALVAINPSQTAEYNARARDYIAQLAELHTWCKEQLSEIPESQRVLITAHDAFGYFGRAYRIEVQAIQGVSTDSEAGIRSINELVDFIISRKIPAVFVESSVPRKAIEALIEGCAARGHIVRVGGELYSDSMGATGTAEGSYIGMVRHNVQLIANSLRGNESGKESTGPQ